MMRSGLQPLAALVDAAAEKWLAAESADAVERDRVQREIAGSFNIGDKDELTFHGSRYILTVFRQAGQNSVDVHRIALNS